MSFELFCITLIALLFGATLVFAGYRLFILLLPIWGFFFGFGLGVQTLQALFGVGFLATVTSWGVGFVLGAIFALLSYLFYLAAVALLSGSLGYGLAVGLLTWIGLPFGALVWLIGLAAGVALAVVVLRFNIQKYAIIVFTALAGTAMVIFTLLVASGSLSLLDLLSAPVRSAISNSGWWLLFFLVMVIGGIVVQWRSTRDVSLTQIYRAPAEPAVPERAAPVAVEAAAPVAAEAAAPVAVAAAGVAAVAAVAAEPEPEVAEAAPVAAAAAAAVAAEPEPEEAEEEVEEAVVLKLDELSLDDDQKAQLSRNLEQVEGIGPVYGGKLNTIGLVTVLDLLSRGATRKGRREIVEATGISPKLVMRWVNNADLFRVRGVSTQYADLLEAAGVDTVVELAQRNPANLLARMTEVNEEKKLVRQLPALSQVEAWVAGAKTLQRVVRY